MKIIIMEGSGRIVNGGSWRSYVDYSRMAYHRRDTPCQQARPKWFPYSKE